MVITNDILTLLGIPSENVFSVKSFTENSHSLIFIDLKDERPCCKYCGHSNTVIKGYYSRKINNSVIKMQNTTVIVSMRRYKCKKCGKSFKQDFKIGATNAKISYAIRFSIIDHLKQMLTFSTIATLHEVSVTSVVKIFDKLGNMQRLPLPKAICIDEFHFSTATYDKQYPCVISDAVSSRIIEVIDSRRKDYLSNYFENKTEFSERNQVKYFVSDMHETYRQIKRKFFKNAVYIVDRFHVIRLFNDAITSIRTKILKNIEYGSKPYNYLKKNWKIFLMKRSELLKKSFVDDETGVVYNPTIELDRCLANYPELSKAYFIKNNFEKESETEYSYIEARKFVYKYINLLESIDSYSLQKIAKTFLNWDEEIIRAYCSTEYGFRLSNSRAEGNNSRIQKLIDISCGLCNFQRLRNRVLYIDKNEKREK